MMVFLFGISIVLVVDLIAMELLCCMTATILQSFWCQFWFGLQPFWFGISFSCQHLGCRAKMSGTDSSEHFLSLVDLLKYFGVERGLLVDRLQEIDYLEAWCSFFGLKLLELRHLARTSSGLNQNIARGSGRLIDVKDALGRLINGSFLVTLKWSY